MAKDKYDEIYRQCNLVKYELSKSCGGIPHWEYTDAWIPNVYAKVGQIVKLKTLDGKWDLGWQIKSANSVTKKQEDLEYHEKISINYGKPKDT